MKNIALRLNRISREKNIPLFASFELTYKCNLNCIHCYKVEEEREEVNTDEVKDIILQLRNSGTLFLLLTGGEILTRQDFLEILEYAGKLNFAIKIFTNGTLIRKEITEKIVKFNPLEIGVSVYSAKKEVHDRITGIPGSFKRTINGIKNLREKGLKVRIKCVLMKENFDDYEDIIKLAKSLGAGFGFDPNIVPKDDGDKEPLKHRIGYNELLKIHNSNRYPVRRFLDTSHSNKQLCSAGRNVVSINPYGDVYPCLMLLIKLGNLRKKNFKNIWRESKEVLNLRKMEFSELIKCPECDLLNYCSRCIGVAHLEEGDIRFPLKRACELARARKEAENLHC